MVKRIVVIGDIHGDMSALLKALMKGNVIDKRLRWIGGDSCVVQMGDQVDKGCRGDLECFRDEDSDVKIIKFMDLLDKEAMKSGGRVYSLIGNHEIMNTLGQLDYVSKAGISGAGGYMNRHMMFSPGGPIAKILARRPVVLKLGSWVFVHGGITPKIAKKYDLNEINNMMKNFLIGNDPNAFMNKDFQELFLESNSLLWNRNYSEDPPKYDSLKRTLKHLNAKGMIVGHTPQENGINCKCGGKIWRVDTAMSEAFGPREKNSKRIQILEIINDGEKIKIIK